MKFLILMMLLSTSVFAENLYNDNGEKVEIQCEVNLVDRGIWWTECPRGSVATGTDARVTRVPFVQTRVSCVVPEVVCNTVEVKE